MDWVKNMLKKQCLILRHKDFIPVYGLQATVHYICKPNKLNFMMM